MVSLDQITEIHDTLGHAGNLTAYLHALLEIGVQSYDSYLYDEHSEYVCKDNQHLASGPIYDTLAISEVVDIQQFLKALKLHEVGEIDYFEMTKRLAASGVERWRFDTIKLDISYFDSSGTTLLHERI